ncbi:MAG: SUMF1/EgtB/PvdO family nonheme iron enzyme [Xanthomonadales bacterium]|nr:SUMF1/EgtB/PvdO family nonheme iron enzyme [Xanthomonadales bacterium]
MIADPPDSDDPNTARRPVATAYRFSHVTTGRYLPTPGGAPGWPFADIGHWMIDANRSADDWVAELRDWRREHLVRIGYDDRHYRRPELAWTQRNFVHVQAMVEDRFLHDPERGGWTVDRYLDDLVARFGGVDSVLLWFVYPNIGVDDRNKTDLLGDLPGGVDGVRAAVDAFHRRGVRVFLPTMPWDHGTREPDDDDWTAMAKLVAATGADGINGDTYNGVPRAFFDACDALGHPVALAPESTISAEEQLIWNLTSWGKKAPDTPVPPVAKFKWCEPRHMIHYENRWGRDRRHDLQYCFFNGIGYNAWENVWGIWNGFTARDAATLLRIASVYRAFPETPTSLDWRPYEPCLQRGVFASRFPGAGRTLWTLVNRNESDLDGDQLRLPHARGTRWFDAWNGIALQPRIDGEHAVIAVPLEGHGFGAVIALAPGADATALDTFLDAQAARAATPLRALSREWTPLCQQCVPIADTAPAANAPDGMVEIPAGEFDFVVGGVEVEGQAWAGTDVQYPWEDDPRRWHRRRMALRRYFIDRTPVTNAQFKAFVDASGYAPRDAHHFLRHWRDGAPLPGTERQPVRWVALEDARAYAAWAGKRLPREWEWQYAAQGSDARIYPWGDAWRDDAAPAPCFARTMRAPDDVDAHAAGASPFGVLDLVGNVWQWTDEYRDLHTRSAVLRGGSLYRPQGSHWYFPQALRNDEHGKLLLMAPCKDRSGAIGFRCVVDAA